MSLTTPKGAPYPAPTDPNDVPGDLEALAHWVDQRPGIATVTTAQRNALSGQNLWPGRMIYNATLSRYEANLAGTPGAESWTPITLGADPWKDFDIELSTTTTPPSGDAYTTSGRYQLTTGKTVHFTVSIFTTGVGASGTGAIRWNLPVEPSSSGMMLNIGTAHHVKSGGIRRMGAISQAVARSVEIVLSGPSSEFYSLAPGSGDLDLGPLQMVVCSGTYEAE